ncbi:MAG TPA: TMEM175 family protein [Gemmatimonadota bacterium]
MTSGHAGAVQRGRDTNRLEAFSDGVFAIAITLLVLEIHVPHAEGDSALWRALSALWPSYLGYLISFVIIGIMWPNHHNIFKHIVRTDHYLVGESHRAVAAGGALRASAIVAGLSRRRRESSGPRPPTLAAAA